jgi:MFS family permease
MRWMGPLATAASAVLVLFAFRLGLVAVLAVLFAAGVFAAFQLAANAAFVQAAPPEYRSQAFGLAQGGMSLGQGLLMVLAGAAVDLWSPGPVIAVFGILGTLAALLVIADHSRASRAAPASQPAPDSRPTPAHPKPPAVPAFLSAPVEPASPAAQTAAGTDVPVGDTYDGLAGPEPGYEPDATNFPAAPPRRSRGRHRAH